MNIIGKIMKLKKDEFKRSEIDAASSKIIDLLIEYVEKNKLIATKNILSEKNIHINDIAITPDPV